jgi:hypothetical protein
MRPWYRFHFSTLFVLAIVLAGLIFINIPGDRAPMRPFRYFHGWPYVYLERLGAEHAFWTFAGTTKMFDRAALALNVLAALCIVALVALPCELWIRRNGRLFRFGIRSMLVATALLAVVMGLGVREVHRCYRQQQVLQELAQYGSVSTRRQLQKYDWLRSFFGDFAHGTITYVDIKATQPIDRFPDLRALADVETMHLEIVNVPDNVGELGAPPKLKDLTVKLHAQGDIEWNNVAALSELPQLGFLWLARETSHESTIRAISTQSPVEALRFDSLDITQADLRRLIELRSLTHIALHESALQNPDSLLLQLSGLRSISFVGNRRSPPNEQRVRGLWPDREIKTGTYADTGENFVSAVRP